MTVALSEKIVPVILSGGSGTRLWPMSRDEHPKQFYGLLDSSTSLMQDTVRRVSDPARFYPPVIMGNYEHRFLIAEQLRQCRVASPDILIEPCARNTAPAITAAALYIRQRYPDALMLVLPTDQHIENTEAFLAGVERAAQAAAKGYLMTFGIKPEYAETGYGYLRRGSEVEGAPAFEVSAFVEKPDAETAKTYIAGEDYFWNSGMFLFSPAALLEEVDRCNPEINQSCREAVARSVADLDFIRLDEHAFSKVPAISIDYAVMEHTKRAALVPLECGWSDTGSWEALWRLSPKDEQGNVGIGSCYLLESRDCYLRNEKGPVIAAYGVENLVIVATRDAVLVTPRENTHSLKALVEHIRAQDPRLVKQNRHAHRPWGMYENIDSGQRYQVKRIHIKPGEKMSLQMHYHRAEHWVVVTGTARVTCDDKTSIVTENQSIYIPCGSIHRIENPGKIALEIIEVQSGAYLREDDILRFDDQYGRISEKS